MPEIEIFVMKSCPHCTTLKNKIRQASSAGKFNCPVKYIDLDGNEDLFEERGIQTVPAIFVNGRRVWQDKLFEMCR